ncbi:MAG: hypothetical protein AABO57_04400 [Acidobacteriota bacterium]
MMFKLLLRNTRALAGTIAALAAILCLASSARAQSKDVGQPTPLTTNSIRGTLEKAENNYYIFQAGPGEVSAALFVEACSPCYAQANVQLFSGNGVTPLCPLAQVTAVNGVTEQKACTARLTKRQPVMLRVGRAQGGPKSTFQVRISGDVAFDSPGAGATETRGTPAGYRTLVIKMKDGSSQEIDLSNVADIIFR